MTVLKRSNEALKASLTRLRPPHPDKIAVQQYQHTLLFQRLFWGALAGCLIAVSFGDSPLLENLELNMLDFRYQTAERLAVHAPGEAAVSNDVAIVAFDDISQWTMESPRFNDSQAQAKLADVLETVESGKPALVAVDLDLRGAANPELVKVFQRYRNVVLAVFGSVEGGSDLPDTSFIQHSVGYGYDELARENNWEVLRLPVNAPNDLGGENSGLAQVCSLTEAITAGYRQLKGLSPVPQQLQTLKADQPVYINFKRLDYPTYSMASLLGTRFDSRVFKDKVVVVGPTLTSRHQDALHVLTPLRGLTSAIYAHADAVSTILDNNFIMSFPKEIAHHLLIVLGALFGAVCSILSNGRRALFVTLGGAAILIAGQVAFQDFHVALPVVAPLAMLLSGLILGTVIFLDTDLRQRNRELAATREQMQVRAEEERKRIAEDLHDDTLPALSAVARMIDDLHQADDKQSATVPERMRVKIDTTIQDMRRVINDLHPSVLETMGFVPALENLGVMAARDAGIEQTFVDRNGGEDYHISDFTKLQLYRVVQEGLNNVVKHAQATRVDVKLQRHAGCLEISVADDGKGFNPKLIRKDSHGLLNIRHRAQLIGATVEWKRPPAFNQGTEMRVSVPLLTGNGNTSEEQT